MLLHKFDISLLKTYGVNTIVGVDEAGRGPLSGPVCACACIIPENCAELLFEVKDSKKLTPKKREILYQKLKTCGVRYAVALVPPQEIDKINILQATFKAMRIAVEKLSICENPLVVVDGNHKIPNLNLKQIPLVKGDNKSLTVASAGIIAKVTRDNYMKELDKLYPVYGFAKHKGYGTAMHYEALKKYGPCIEHRKTFLPEEMVSKK